MSAVCNLFSFMCMRETQKKKYSVKPTVHPNRQAYDAIVVWKGKENQKPKPGGISFDVILQPAAVESPRLKNSPGEVKKREVTKEEIESRHRKAWERKSLIEKERQEQLLKERQKAIDVMTKAQNETEQFSKKTKEKLRRSMEVNRGNRETQIRALQERLKEHRLKVQEVQKAGEDMVREFEEKSEVRLTQKMSTYEENRQNQLKKMLNKLQEHASHINEVCTASENRSQSSDELQEQLVQKMENALKNREEQLRSLQDRLSEHENRIKEVQKKKVSSPGDAPDLQN